MLDERIVKRTDDGYILTVDGLESCLIYLELLRESGNINNEYYMRDVQRLRSIVPMTGLRVRTDTQGYRQVYSYEPQFEESLPFAANMREQWDFQREMNIVVIDVPDDVKSEFSYYTHHEVGSYSFDTKISYEQYEAYLSDGWESSPTDAALCDYGSPKFWVSEEEIDHIAHCVGIGRCRFDG